MLQGSSFSLALLCRLLIVSVSAPPSLENKKERDHGDNEDEEADTRVKGVPFESLVREVCDGVLEELEHRRGREHETGHPPQRTQTEHARIVGRHHTVQESPEPREKQKRRELHLDRRADERKRPVHDAQAVGEMQSPYQSQLAYHGVNDGDEYNTGRKRPAKNLSVQAVLVPVTPEELIVEAYIPASVW